MNIYLNKKVNNSKKIIQYDSSVHLHGDPPRQTNVVLVYYDTIVCHTEVEPDHILSSVL